MYRILICISVLLGFYSQASAQQSFRFLELAGSARAQALGGTVVSGPADAGLWLQNPALLDSSLSGQLMLSHQWFYGGVQQSSFAYAQDFARTGVIGLGVQYLNYGEMQGYDAAGLPTGTFYASDYVVQLSHARRWKHYRFGGSLKWASSGIAAYRSHALLLDAGGVFSHPEKGLIAAFSIRNLGLVVQNFTDAGAPALPFELSMGLTFKPQFMPLRFTATAQHLQQPDLGTADPAAPLNKEEPPVVDNIMRHFALGAEFLLSPNLNIRGGYNHLRRQELRVGDTAGMSGFSMGLMLQIRSLRLEYTRAWYHVAGGTNQLGLVVGMNRIFNNKI